MKKIMTSLSIIVLALVLCGNILIKKETKDFSAHIYYVDHSMLRLIPVNTSFEKTTKEKAAKQMIKKLIEGQDKNPKILRIIPKKENCIEVKIKDNRVIVNFKKEFIKNKPENKIHGLLAIYSIVNSLTSIEGSDTVNFLIDGKSEKGFVHGLDMRLTFIPDYYMCFLFLNVQKRKLSPFSVIGSDCSISSQFSSLSRFGINFSASQSSSIFVTRASSQ